MFTRILVPTDFSEPSDAALEYGRTLAERFGASLNLVHVLEDPVVTGAFGAEVYVPETPGMHEGLYKDAMARLEHRMPATLRRELHGSTEIIAGTCAKAIVEYARDRGIDLIVMGTHGRSGVAHVLMGSVAERVVRTAPCPVLTVRSEGVPATEFVHISAGVEALA